MAKKTAKKVKPVDPLDAALEGKEKLAARHAASDIQAWEAWKTDPNETNMNTLMQRFTPLIRQKVQQYKAPAVSEDAMKANLQVHAINAFKTYDPSKAGLRTHVENAMRRGMRFNAYHQNMAYLPEGQTAYIGVLDRAKDELFEQLGRDPTNAELTQHINSSPQLLGDKKPLTLKTTTTIETGRRRDIFASAPGMNTASSTTDRNRQILPLLRFELTPDQQQVFDHLYGLNGAKVITGTGALADQLGKSSSQISRIKSSIGAAFKKYT